MGSGRGLIDEDEDDEDRASSVFGERLFTPPVGQGSSLVSSPATSRTGGGGGGVNVRPVTQNSLPTSQQVHLIPFWECWAIFICPLTNISIIL